MEILADGKPVETKRIWVAWTNTDLTEGRGEGFPYVVCDSPETANRHGKGSSVQGSNCKVTEGTAFRFPNDSVWHIPGRVEPETKADSEARMRREEKERAIEAKEKVLDKARAAGLTEDEIEILRR